jgi:hypothetical protein
VSIINGRLPIKVTAATFESADAVAVVGFVLTNSGAAAVGQAVIQDGHNNDIASLNTTATNGVASVFFPNPISVTGLSVPALTGTGAVLYIYLADV